MYASTSPYYKTKVVNGQYLDLLQIRPIPAEPDDVLYTIEPQYTYRPDHLHLICTEIKIYGGCFHSVILKN